MDIERFKRAVDNMDKSRKAEIDLENASEDFKAFAEEFKLLDPSLAPMMLRQLFHRLKHDYEY